MVPVAAILAQYLQSNGIGEWPEDMSANDWGLTYGAMPENDKKWIRVQGQGARDGSRQMRGSYQKFPEFQVRVRGLDDDTVEAKFREIVELFDAAYMVSVSWQGRDYRIQNIMRQGDPAFLKQEEKEEIRSWILNGNATIYEE